MIKKVLLFAIFSYLSSPVSFAQNLIPNPSFECGPEGKCYFTTLDDVDFFSTEVCNWSLPNNGTSDVYSTRLPDSCWSHMPNSTFRDARQATIGSQAPRTGNRFVGIYTFSGFQMIFVDGTPSYREYIQTLLTSPLIPGESYCVEMFVSLAEQPIYAANNIGFFFSDNIFYPDQWHESYAWQGFRLPFTPQIVEDTIITDTVNWVRVSGIYQATFAAQALVIGSFFEDRDTKYVQQKGRPPFINKGAYYFIDDVSVERIQTKSFSFSDNTTICAGDTTSLKAFGGLYDIEWTALNDPQKTITRGETLTVKLDKTTSFEVKGRNCNLIVRDTITIYVKPSPHVDLGRDTVICVGTTIKLNSGSESAVWQDNSTNQYYNVTQAGNYSVTVKNDFDCKSYDEINISFKPLPKVDLGHDTLTCKDFFPIVANGGDVTYLWSTGSRDSVIYPVNSGTYWVTLQNRCGIATDSIHIYSLSDIFIPNVLTLNRDSLNEVFGFRGIGEQDVKCWLRIVNRWGKEIYRNDDYKQNWPPVDDELPQGTYYYFLGFENCSEYKGWIHVLK